MGTEPTGPRLERITPSPLTFEIWTRATHDASGHPVEVSIPNMQEAFKRLAAYGGPAFFEIRDSEGILVYEAGKEEPQHHHYHAHAASTPSSPPRNNERMGMMIVFGLVALIVVGLIAGNSRSSKDEPVSADMPGFAADAATGPTVDAGSANSVRTITCYSGMVNAASAEHLIRIVSNSIDKVICLKLAVETDSTDRYSADNSDGQLNITVGDPMDGATEFIVNGDIGTTMDMWSVDGFYLIKSGGTHAAGVISIGAQPVDEGRLRLEDLRVVDRAL